MEEVGSDGSGLCRVSGVKTLIRAAGGEVLCVQYNLDVGVEVVGPGDGAVRISVGMEKGGRTFSVC